MQAALHIELPEFLARENAVPRVLPAAEARMRFVLDLLRANIAAGGGPFAAAVFEADGGRLLAAGVNRVVAGHCSTAHAEILALSLAQQRIGNHDLGAAGLPTHELVASAAPCAMCLGAIAWSGVRRVVCAARAEDVAALGFDEGPKPDSWVDALQARGIAVVTDLLRADAVALLHGYRAAGGPIYNARGGAR